MRNEASHHWLVLFGSAALALALVGGPLGFLHAQSKQLLAWQRERESLRTAMANTRATADTITRLQPRLLALAARGVLEPATPLPWLEVLREAGQRLQLPTLAWRLEPPQPYQPPGLPAAGGPGIAASELVINADLRHAGELAALLALLTSERNGLVTVRSCQLQSLGQAGFHAQCTLARLTLAAAAPGP